MGCSQLSQSLCDHGNDTVNKLPIAPSQSAACPAAPVLKVRPNADQVRTLDPFVQPRQRKCQAICIRTRFLARFSLESERDAIEFMMRFESIPGSWVRIQGPLRIREIRKDITPKAGDRRLPQGESLIPKDLLTGRRSRHEALREFSRVPLAWQRHRQISVRQFRIDRSKFVWYPEAAFAPDHLIPRQPVR